MKALARLMCIKYESLAGSLNAFNNSNYASPRMSPSGFKLNGPNNGGIGCCTGRDGAKGASCC